MQFIPLAILQRHLISRTRGMFTKSTDFLTTEQIDELISEAYVEIVRQTQCLTSSDSQTTSTSNPRYAAPADILDQLVTRLAVKIRDNEFAYPDRRTWDFMRELYGDFSIPAGAQGPRDWSFAGDNQEQLIVMYPPESAVADGLIVDYVQNPGELTGVYDQSAITVAFTNGSPAITFSASIAGNVLADMAIGRKSAAAALPTKFYRLLSIDGATTATLTENFAEVTDAAALFVASPVSPLEYKRPGLVRYAPIEYARARIIELDEGSEAAMSAFEAFERELARIKRQSGAAPGLVFREPNALARFPAMRRKAR
jgi:hypothetical protein